MRRSTKGSKPKDLSSALKSVVDVLRNLNYPITQRERVANFLFGLTTHVPIGEPTARKILRTALR